jgi:hypothetical protein
MTLISLCLNERSVQVFQLNFLPVQVDTENFMEAYGSD